MAETYVHFIAIGGSVMHQLAIALKNKGYLVSGSDDEIFEPALSNLSKSGILPRQMGWFPENITPSINSVILGMHAREDNPELVRAKELGLKIYSFPEYIYQESRKKTRVAIGGSHGKTSTTSMIMHALKGAGKKFDYLVGAQLQGFSQSVQVTDADVIICEADEYPASTLEKRPKFHFLFPHIAVITGIAWDHINVFPTFEFYLEQFSIFIDKIEPGGVLIYNQQDKTLITLVEANQRKDIRYLSYHLPTYFVEDGITSVVIEGVKSALKIFGNHNLANLEAAWLVCHELGVQAEIFVQNMASFTGASNRLELLYSSPGCKVFRDFAHAPSKVKATIEAVKQQFPDHGLVAVLELHTYSSLNKGFLSEYRLSMQGAGNAAIFYSPHALEIKRMPALRVESIKDGFAKQNLEVFTNNSELRKWILSLNLEHSNLLLMSSGTYDGLDLNQLVAEIKNKPL